MGIYFTQGIEGDIGRRFCLVFGNNFLALFDYGFKGTRGQIFSVSLQLLMRTY